MFPIQIRPGGAEFSYCPGKARWEPRYNDMFRMLVLATELQKLPYDGGLFEQPDWWIELASWFVPLYNQEKFISRARSILGDGNTTAAGIKTVNLQTAPKPGGSRRGNKK